MSHMPVNLSTFTTTGLNSSTFLKHYLAYSHQSPVVSSFSAARDWIYLMLLKNCLWLRRGGIAVVTVVSLLSLNSALLYQGLHINHTPTVFFWLPLVLLEVCCLWAKGYSLWKVLNPLDIQKCVLFFFFSLSFTEDTAVTQTVGEHEAWQQKNELYFQRISPESKLRIFAFSFIISDTQIQGNLVHFSCYVIKWTSIPNIKLLQRLYILYYNMFYIAF